MNDAGSAIKDAYWNFFQALTDAGKSVKVYNRLAPSGATPPYVILNGWTAQSDNTKTSFGQTGEFTLQVVDRMPESLYSEVRANRIANAMTTLLKPTPVAEPLSIAGFTHWSVVNTPLELREPNAADVVYRKIITVYHSLQEL